jgi:type I restriction enzyme S subunit
VNWIMISDATSKYITSTKKRIIKEGMKKSREVHPGDFLLTNSMSFGRPYIMQTSGCIHDGWLVLSPQPALAHPDYFYYLLGSDVLYAEFERRAAGATVKNLNIELVKGVEVLLPPLAEQRRIAEVLDRVEALRATRRAALTQLDALTQSLFLDLFGDTESNSKSWRKGTLGDVATFVGGGTPSRARPEFFEGTICWATSKDMKCEFLNDTQEHITTEAIEQSATNLVPAGTVLIVVKSKILAHSLPVAIARVPTCFGQDLKGMKVSAQADVDFVTAALRSGQRWLLERARGINTEGLTLEHLKAFPLLLPPVELQRKFAHRVRAVEKLKTAALASLAEMDTLLATLQHRAFRGEL